MPGGNHPAIPLHFVTIYLRRLLSRLGLRTLRACSCPAGPLCGCNASASGPADAARRPRNRLRARPHLPLGPPCLQKPRQLAARCSTQTTAPTSGACSWWTAGSATCGCVHRLKRRNSSIQFVPFCKKFRKNSLSVHVAPRADILTGKQGNWQRVLIST